MERLRLEPADGGVIELPGDVARDVVHPEPEDLVGDAAGDLRQAIGDQAVEGGGRHPVAGIEGEIEDDAGRLDGLVRDGAGVQVGEEPALGPVAVLALRPRARPRGWDSTYSSAPAYQARGATWCRTW